MNGKNTKINTTTGMKINTNKGGVQSSTNTNTFLNNNSKNHKQNTQKI